MKRTFLLISCILIIFLYFFLRLGWANTIDFSYDQPHHALIIKDFIDRGTFLTSQEFSQDTHWHYLSWGPAFNYFFAPFFLFLDNPLTISITFAIFNVVSVALLMYLCFRFFGSLVTIITGLFMVSYPWWVIFSRMIYQPSPGVSVVVLSMLLLFLSHKYPKKIYTTFLIVSWGVLIQIHLNTFSFIFVSFVASMVNIKRYSKKYLILGLALAFAIFIPSIKYYYQNTDRLFDYIKTPGRFTPPQETIIERVSDVSSSFFHITSGGMFESVLGYANKDFVKQNPKLMFSLQTLIGVFIVGVLLYHLVGVIKKPKNRFYKGVLLAWSTSQLWFLSIFWVSQLIPRYYLYVMPSVFILMALFIEDMLGFWKKYIKQFSVIFIILPILISLHWSVFIVKYYHFLLNYSYPHGKLRDVAEAPYGFLKDSIDWVINDASNKGYSDIVLSNDFNNPKKYSMWYSTKYVWKYVYGKNSKIANNPNTGYYLFVYSDILNREEISNYKKYGPFVVFDQKDNPQLSFPSKGG